MGPFGNSGNIVAIDGSREDGKAVEIAVEIDDEGIAGSHFPVDVGGGAAGGGGCILSPYRFGLLDSGFAGGEIETTVLFGEGGA